MNGYYGIAMWLTYLNMISGVVGIGFAFAGNAPFALICLIVSGVCDMFDGTVAKRCERCREEKIYGIQIDALADLVSFGVLPGAIGFALGMQRFPWVLPVALYVLAALIRLAYFNVTELANFDKGEARAFYEGLPVTSVAAILPFWYLLKLCFDFPAQPVYGILLALIAAGFVAKFRVPKPKMPHLIAMGVLGALAVIVLTCIAVCR